MWRHISTSENQIYNMKQKTERASGMEKGYYQIRMLQIRKATIFTFAYRTSSYVR
jgi:hypothetical protein